MGNKIETEVKNIYYVYVYLDPRKPGKYIYGKYKFDFEPFYIGKGCSNRAFNHLQKSSVHNTKKCSLIKDIIEQTKNKPIILILNSNLHEKESLDLETEYIDTIGRLNANTGPLTNKHRKGRLTIEKNNKKIIQFNLEGKFIKEWTNYSTAERTTNINSILDCLKKFTKTAGKYIWFYKDDFKDGKIPKKLDDIIIKEANTIHNENLKIKVIQLTKEGIFLNEFSSIKEASKHTNIGRSSISRVCSGHKNFKTAGGFIWKYKNQKTIQEFKKSKNKSPKRKKINQISKEGKVIKTWNSASEVARVFKTTVSNISEACLGYVNNKTAKGFMWKYKKDEEIAINLEPEIGLKNTKRKINQFSISGIFIKTWDSIKEASETLKISKNTIVDVCAKRIGKNGKQSKTAGGFIWRYFKKEKNIIDLDEETVKHTHRKSNKKVIQFSKNNIIINTWNTISEASRETGITRQGISKVCAKKPKYKTAGGFIWKYANQLSEFTVIYPPPNNEPSVYL